MLLAMTILTGVVYPLVITAAAGVFMKRQAEGSQILRDGKIIGSELIAQKFTDEKYFWPRPSGSDFGAVPSGASNMAMTNAALKKAVDERIEAFRKANGLAPNSAVPPEMAYASGSGLDPHISPQAARVQISRVAKARKFTEEQKKKLEALVEESIQEPQWGIFGTSRVNVLLLNLDLDNLK